MIPLLLIRHGKTAWNIEKKLQGRRDIPLSEQGRNQLQNCILPSEFRHFSWTSSPLVRATETAEILGALNPLVEPRLIEMHWGDWEGNTVRDLRARYGETMVENEARGLNMKPPGGESPADVQKRLRPWLKSLTKPTIAVTHKGVIRALKSLAYDWDMTCKSPTTFDWNCAHLFKINEQGMPIVDRVNISLEK